MQEDTLLAHFLRVVSDAAPASNNVSRAPKQGSGTLGQPVQLERVAKTKGAAWKGSVKGRAFCSSNYAAQCCSEAFTLSTKLS